MQRLQRKRNSNLYSHTDYKHHCNLQSWPFVGCAVLLCSSKSYFHANFTIKISYCWDRSNKITYPKSKFTYWNIQKKEFLLCKKWNKCPTLPTSFKVTTTCCLLFVHIPFIYISSPHEQRYC